MIIDRVEVRAVGPQVQKYTWSHDLPDQYMTNTIVRITTDDGAVGIGAVANYTSYDYDRYTTETLRHMIPILIGNIVCPAIDVTSRMTFLSQEPAVRTRLTTIYIVMMFIGGAIGSGSKIRRCRPWLRRHDRWHSA